MQWNFIERAYGEYIIHPFKTKRDALWFARCHEYTANSPKRVHAGCYEYNSRHLICKTDQLASMGYEQFISDRNSGEEPVCCKFATAWFDYS